MRLDSPRPRGLRRSARARPEGPAPAPGLRQARAAGLPARRAQAPSAGHSREEAAESQPRARSYSYASLSPLQGDGHYARRMAALCTLFTAVVRPVVGLT